MAKTDFQLKQEVEAEMRRDPKVNPAHIGVTVSEGAVSLMGEVENYPGRQSAAEAAGRVDGVRSVSERLTVKLRDGERRSDPQLLAAARDILTWNVWVPAGVSASAQRGTLTLAGCVEWPFQRAAAECAVQHLTGLFGVENEIRLESEGPTESVEMMAATSV